MIPVRNNLALEKDTFNEQTFFNTNSRDVDLNNEECFFQEGFEIFEKFHSESRMNCIEKDFASKTLHFYNEEIVNDPFELFNIRCTPKSDEVPRYKSLSFKDMLAPQNKTCVTQKSYESSNDENHEEKECNDLRHSQNKQKESLPRKKSQKYQEELNKIIEPSRKIKPEGINKEARRDVINKTIFRIIRRFFHSLLENLIPDYKYQKRSNLMNMLASFTEFLLPNEDNIIEISEVLSALMFRREILLIKRNSDQRRNIQIFLDVQSKYTHKLLNPVLGNKYFKVIFQYFLQNGIPFLNNDENVKNNPEKYAEEFEKIQEIYNNTSEND